MISSRIKIAIIERVDVTSPPSRNTGLEPIFAALETLGATATSVLYSEGMADQLRAQLLECDGALVWVNPVQDGVDRTALDALLRDVAACGLWVSAQPDVISKMGVKAVLPRTKTLGWGSDAYAYESAETFRSQFPKRLAMDGVRVLKPNRGNASQGVLKVALMNPTDLPDASSIISVVEARGDVIETGVRFGEFLNRFDAYYAAGGMLIDQDLQPRVREGLVRCYMCRNTVVGFSEQFPRNEAAGHAAPSPFGMLSDKTMHEKTEARFQGLRRRMETDWTPGLQALLDIKTSALPVLWDADFFYGAKPREDEDTFILCEINTSCVNPFPRTAASRIAQAAIAQTKAFKASFSA